jgi:hypothetical protein
MQCKEANPLISCLACGITAQHPAKKTPRRLDLLGGLVVVQRKRVLLLSDVGGRAIDIYNIGALVCVVALQDSFGRLVVQADGRVG